MKLRIVLFAVLLGVLAGPAQALDRPRLDVLGFSPDGRFFAFRQSGTDEGSGVAFADLFITDTTSNKWVPGTPIRLRAMPSEGNIRHVRELLDNQSSRLLRRLGLNRANTGVAFVPRDRTRMALDLPGGQQLKLEIIPMTGLAAPGCPVTAPIEKGSLLGFALTASSGKTTAELHEDTIIPRARGCAVAYRFASGFIKPRGSDTVVAAMLAYREIGLDGAPRLRYLAVTGVVPATAQM